ncbi:MAG TPA: ribbon-helix-helix domain-containing protein [Caulobacteraceae bacterium]|nr:ribbon-helix-helix domain-containing protein [Caulobacteraceae bacterium]
MLKKRSLSLAGHATSLALEPEFWTVLEAMAAAEGLSLPELIVRIDGERGRSLLASACRVRALAWAGRRQDSLI